MPLDAGLPLPVRLAAAGLTFLPTKPVCPDRCDLPYRCARHHGCLTGWGSARMKVSHPLRRSAQSAKRVEGTFEGFAPFQQLLDSL